MKKLITILSAILFAGGLLAQAPYKMSYQTVIRDGGGALVTSQQVGIKISILRGSANGTVSYSEIFNPAPKTNANGLLSLEIGTGVAVTGMIDTINWEDGLYYIMTETDPSGGSSYSITGTSQLLSVPFAFSAANGNWKKSMNNISNSNPGNIGIGTNAPAAKLDVIGNMKITDGTEGTGKVLTSDYNGFASWTNPSVIETDPEVASSMVNKIARWNGTALVDGIVTDNGANIGIGTNTPVAKLDVAGTFKVADGTQGQGKLLTSDSAGLASWQTLTIVETDPEVNNTIANKVARWNGTALVDGIMTDNGTNVGIGTNTPVAKLDVVGSLKVTNGSQGVGKVMTSDAAGVASWVTPSTLETDPQVSNLVTNKIAKWNGTSLVDGIMTDNGTYIGIGTINPNATLDLVGTFQYKDGTQGSGKLLTSNASGDATWVTPSAIETDPQVNSATTNKLSKWNGTALVDGIVTDNGTNIGIGTNTPVTKLDLIGNFKLTDGSQGIGKLLVSDAAGVASWATASSVETDPQVTSNVANKVAKWNGTSLTDGMIYDNGQFVGIGTTTPSAKLHVYGSIKYNDGNEGTGKVLTSDVNGLASWQTPIYPTHFVGENYGGGIVFFVYDDGHHGLIAATEDFSSSVPLYNGTNRNTGASGDGLGAGEMNTTLMVATQIGDPLGTGFAAKICADHYSATAILYGDWYLPSKYELNLLYQNQIIVGGLSGTYWSSTEVDAVNAFVLNFSNGGTPSSEPKSINHKVRPIRGF